MSRIASIFSGLMMVFLISGCTIVPGLHINEGSPAERDGYRVVALSAQIVAEQARLRPAERVHGELIPLSPTQVANEYLIGAGDVISVVVWDHPELTNPSGEFRDPVSSGRLVNPDGTMFYPHVGAFLVAGKTITEVRSFLAKELAKIIQKPQVDVRVAAFRAQRIQVTGEVKQPGIVTLDDTAKGVLEAIGERGGLTPEASRRLVLLQRAGQTYRIDLAGLLSGSRPVANPVILPGDVVHIPDAGFDRVFVMGEVKNSAPVTMLQTGLTLTEALTTAGGLDRLSARDSGVLVFRRGQETVDGVPSIYVLDLGRPEGMLLANEFELSPRDVVYVKATAFSKYNSIINQLLPTISAVFQIDRLTNSN